MCIMFAESSLTKGNDNVLLIACTTGGRDVLVYGLEPLLAKCPNLGGSSNRTCGPGGVDTAVNLP